MVAPSGIQSQPRKLQCRIQPLGLVLRALWEGALGLKKLCSMIAENPLCDADIGRWMFTR